MHLRAHLCHPACSTSIGGNGATYGFNLHGDYQINSNFVVGVFGTYEKLNDKFKLNVNLGGAN
jgi:hypothetical protein